jgi:predicted CoA-binding protein
MPIDGMTDAAIADLLHSTRRIALVGASARADRASNHVLAFLLRHGWDVTPVNPGLAGQSLYGRPVVGALDEAGPLDMVDIFRAADRAGEVVDDAIRLGARSVWLQLGVIDQDAARRARAAGLIVAMDRCPAIEVPRLRLEPAAGPRHVETVTGSFRGDQ